MTAQLAPGTHSGILMSEYLDQDALGSDSLNRLAVSPLSYAYSRRSRSEETDATRLGTALHMAVLEPGLYVHTYIEEPDLDELCPGAASPRATKAYKAWRDDVQSTGRIVLKDDFRVAIEAMRASVLAHPHASRVIERSLDRELTMIWSRDGRRCRGRADVLGRGLLADLKTTRSLRTFSPFTITSRGYWRQAAWYVDGLRRLGHEIEHVFLIAIENAPPYDVGVFTLDREVIAYGESDNSRLLGVLAECERTGTWPGMFTDIQPGLLTDSALAELAEEEVA